LNTERRAVARYRAKIAIQIGMDEYQLDAESMEVSLQGLRVVCEGSLANTLFNKYIQVTPGANIVADIQIKTPRARGLMNTLKGRARVISVSRVSQNSYIVGFNIIEFDSEAEEIWQDYISTKY